jgi:hypothetical protein
MRATGFVYGFVLATMPLHPQIAPSENCKKPPQTVAPGTYTGDWEAECKLQGGPQHANLALRLLVKGDLKLKVGENERLTSAESVVTSSFGGEGDVAGFLATSTQEGQGTLSLKRDQEGAVTPRFFLMSGSGSAKGELQIHTPMSKATPTSGAGELQGRFVMVTSACGVLSGDFRSDLLTTQMENMAGVGYAVTWTKPGRWQVKAEGEDTFAKRRQELHKELEQSQQTASGIVYRREGEGRKLVAALEKIKTEKEPLKSCLQEDWMEWVQSRTATWVAEDAASLKGTHKNASLYREHLARLISSLRQFALLGCDTCYAALQEKGWSALQAEMEARLQLLVDQAAEVEDVLAESRQAELLGEISPRARERVWAYVKQAALQRYRVERASLKLLYSAGKDKPPSAAEAMAFRRTMAAARLYVLIGGEDILDALDMARYT